MNCFSFGFRRGANERFNIQITLTRRRRTNADGFVGKADVHRVGVGGRVDRHRLDTHFVARAVDTQRDLAAVGDQELFNGHMLISRW